MKIDAPLPLPENTPIQKSTRSATPKTRTSDPGGLKDQAQLSADSRTVDKVKLAISSLPEVRQDKVNALREAISAGTYNVSDLQLARAIGADISLVGQLNLR